MDIFILFTIIIVILVVYYCFYKLKINKNHCNKIFILLLIIFFDLLLLTYNSTEISSNNSRSLYFLFVIIVFILICVLLNNIFKLYYSKYKNTSLKNFPWYIIIVPSLLSVPFIYIDEIKNIQKNKLIIHFIIILQFIIILMYILFYFKSKQTKKLETNYASLQHKEANVKAKYNLINSQYINSIKYIHDSRDKLIALNNQIKNQEYDTISEELEKINNDILKAMNLLSTDSQIINLVIENFLDEFHLLNITIKPIIEYRDFNFATKLEQSNFFNDLFKILIDYIKSYNQPKTEKLIILKSKTVAKKPILQIILSKHSNNMILENSLKEQIISLSKHYNVTSKVLINLQSIEILFFLK